MSRIGTLRGSGGSSRGSSALFTTSVLQSQFAMMETLSKKLDEAVVDEKTLDFDFDRDLPLVDDKVVDDHYTFKDMIGEGATSEVFSALDKKNNEEVAIKIMNNAKIKMNRSLLREIKIMKELDHPNIIKLKNVLRTEKELFIVMELAQGEPLFETLCSKKTYTEQDAKTIVKGILSAVAYMHSKGIAHRDIKPENVLCYETESGEIKVKLVDFGFATTEADGMATPLGTLGYKAPELIKKEAHSMTVDCWSLGVMTYIILCGFPPFFSVQGYKDDTDFLFNTPFWYFFNKETPDLEAAILSGTHDFPEQFWKNISNDAKNFVDALLQIDVSKRLVAKEALQHPWLTKGASKETLRPLRESNTNKSVAELLRATSQATLARRSLNISQLLSTQPSSQQLSFLDINTRSSRSIRNNTARRSIPLNFNKAPEEIPVNETPVQTNYHQDTSIPMIVANGAKVLEEAPIRTGWIEIKGLSVFTKRWVVLRPGALCYYKSDKDDPLDYFGVINLVDTKVYVIDQTLLEIKHPHQKQIFFGSLPGAPPRQSSLSNALYHRQSSAILKVSHSEELLWVTDIQKAIDAKDTKLFAQIEQNMNSSSNNLKSPRRESISHSNSAMGSPSPGIRKSLHNVIRKSASSLLTVAKKGILEVYTNNKWKTLKVFLLPDRISVLSKAHKPLEKGNKCLEIFISDITSVKTEFGAGEHTWISKNFKVSEDNPWAESMWLFAIVEKGKTFHYFRSEDRSVICDWVLSMEQLKVPGKHLMENEEKNLAMEYQFSTRFKGGLVKWMKKDEYWMFSPKESSLFIFNTNSNIREGSKQWHLAWNGRSLIPSIHAPSNCGSGYWDGNVLEWRETPERNSRLLSKYKWHKEIESFVSADGDEWKWEGNCLVGEGSAAVWQVTGDVPPVLVLCLQMFVSFGSSKAFLIN
eukprot:TRINITY_DN3298_c0_g2_i1.p1 TRINITY_DN3298_c0_g2~~TRINITY_DN3298_c0_g2_i1.p1  ORF type:complete len:925 (+),score=289.55 TRINITY_DN3298_c0_g2_i1:82-2856(+)